jgi:hypothetical protein
LSTNEQKTFEFQPTDDNGLPIGGKQVIKYTDPAQLPFLLAEQNTLLIRKLRQQTKNSRLGIVEKEDIDENAPRFASAPDFTPKILTKEERAQLSRDLLDEENFDSAIGRIVEARGLGQAQEAIQTLSQEVNTLKALREVEIFQQQNPDYIVCDENAQTLVAWLVRYNLNPVAANFQRAYDTLKAAGVLVTSLSKVENPQYVAPVSEIVETEIPDGERVEIPEGEIVPITVVEQPVTPPEEEHPALHREAPPAPPRQSRVPLGLSRSSSVDGGVPVTAPIGSELVYEIKDPQSGRVLQTLTGQQALNAMPSDEYKRRIRQPGFVTLVNKIEAETQRKRAAARG